jgi:HAD superfamily hydrolase (TIGR01509 family)
VFDLDGVLIDSEGLQYRAYMEALAPWGASVDRETYAREWIATGHGPEYAVKTFGLPITPKQLRERKDPIYRRLLIENAALMPGAADAVPALARHYRLAVATNSTRGDTEYVLGRFGLLPHFRAVVTRETYRDAKPAPDAFLAAARACGALPERCVVVEDSERGLLAARAAGIRAVAVPNEWTAASDLGGATRRIASLAELTPELVEEVLASDA